MTRPITLIKADLSKQGGLEKYTWQIAKSFCEKGSPVTLLTTGSILPPLDHSLLKIVTLPVRRTLSYLSVSHFDKACHEYLTKHPSDLVFSLDRNRFQTHLRAGNGIHAAYLKRRAREEGLPKRLSFNINPLHQTILSLEKKALEHKDLKVLFTNSEMVKQEALHYYAIDPNKIQVVHNGVEWKKMQKPFDNWEKVRKEQIHRLGLNLQAFQLLFVGSNFKRKGLEKLLHALSFIQEEPFQLSVVGSDKHLSYFQSLAKRLGLHSKVFFWGQQEHPLAFYQTADALVIPSLYDPFANVTVEALAMGLFTLSSKHNGGYEVLSDTNGLVIPNLDDTQEFAALLKQVLSRPKTPQRAQTIRESVKHLDFSYQLKHIVDTTLSPQ